jgi:hypothetical protein
MSIRQMCTRELWGVYRSRIINGTRWARNVDWCTQSKGTKSDVKNLLETSAFNGGEDLEG